MNTMLIVITVMSVIAAVAAAGIAWRVVRDDRRRADARVALLAADIHAANLPDRPDQGEAPLPGARALFNEEAEPARPRFAAIAAAGALIVGSAVLAVVLSSTSGSADAGKAAPRANSASEAPLELVALTHEREPDRITVRGVVRNPATSGAARQLVAIVSLFDAAGGFVATARAGVDASDLAPGSESTFSVTVPASEVGRYRVSFGSDAGVVPHVDARKL